MRYASHRKRVCIFVSRYDHCLSELLWRWRRGELYADIPLVISNHAEMEREAARFDVRFEHVPVTPDTKPAAERAHLELLGGSFDLIVLARYMQILSPTFLEAARTPIINIHHSFLPAFAGANPYARAYERGVKLIGATAHYVTEELDAGPIIEQDVARVTHARHGRVARARGRRHRADRARRARSAGTSRTACSRTATARSCSSRRNTRASCRHSPVDDDLTPIRRGAAGGGRPGRVPGALRPLRRARLRLLRAPVRRPRRGVRPDGRDVRAGVDRAPRASATRQKARPRPGCSASPATCC